MKTLYTAIAFLLPFAASADLVLDIRGNDPGLMEMVSAEDVTVIKTLDFIGPSQWFTQKEGFFINSMLTGMSSACLETDRNPCQFDNTPGCMSPVGRVFDEPKPTLPFGVTAMEPGTTVGIMHYDTRRSQTGRASFSRGGCGPIDSGGCDWGDCPWSVVFPEPYTAVCFDTRFDGPTFNMLRRQHFNFWADNNGTVEMVGHFDMVGEAVQSENTFCWVSDVPFQAVTTWQNGPGVWWIKVHVGEAATTSCERATRKADELVSQKCP